MTTTAETQKSAGKSMTAFGILSIIFGILAMLAPGLTGFSIALLLGGLVLVGGVLRMVWAFQAGGLGKGLLGFAIGLLTFVCGILLIANPLFAAGFLTMLLAIYFILDGGSEIAAGFRLRPGSGWGMFIFSGIVSVLLGFMIWAQYPLSGIWAMGVLVGIKLFFIGLLMLTAGSASARSAS